MRTEQWWGRWTDPKILVGVPTTGSVPTLFMTSLIDMVVWMKQDGVESTIHTVNGSLLPKSRNICAQLALDEGFTHLLFIDSDQIFPATTPNQLFSHRLPIVACNIATKKIPPQQTACLRPLDGVTEHARPPKCNHGLEKVWRVGCGVMLIETEVFRRIPKPWFFFGWDDTAPEPLEGEDWYFLRKTEAAGIPLYVDHDLSAQIGHWGGYNFRLPGYHV